MIFFPRLCFAKKIMQTACNLREIAFSSKINVNIFAFQASNRVPKLTINLGPRCDSGSNGGLSSPAKKHHHKHKKHKKKRKRQIDSDDEDDDVVELSNDSDEDYRV